MKQVKVIRGARISCGIEAYLWKQGLDTNQPIKRFVLASNHDYIIYEGEAKHEQHPTVVWPTKLQMRVA